MSEPFDHVDGSQVSDDESHHSAVQDVVGGTTYYHHHSPAQHGSMLQDPSPRNLPGYVPFGVSMANSNVQPQGFPAPLQTHSEGPHFFQQNMHSDGGQ